MDERDHAVGTLPGFRIDQIEACGLKTVDLGTDVESAKRDVMQAGSAPLQKSADRALGTHRFEELHGSHEGDAHALGTHGLDRGTRTAGDALEKDRGA